jgi:hypothetical protein
MMSAAKRQPESRRSDGRPVPRSGTYRRAAPGGALDDYRQEHDDIHGWLGKLQTDNPLKLSVALLGFRSVLLLHFAKEEGRDGLFELVRQHCGQDRRIESLRSQHHEMLVRIHRLQSIIETASVELSTRVVELRDELVALVTSHEHTESALLQDLLLTDLGEGF